MEPVLRFFEEQIGLGTLVLLITIVCVAWAAWKLSSIYTKKTVEIESLPCDKHEKMIEDLSTSVQQINFTLGKIDAGQESIYKMMSIMASSSPMSQLTKSHSPISLTEKGKEIAKILAFDDVLNKTGKMSRIL